MVPTLTRLGRYVGFYVLSVPFDGTALMALAVAFVSLLDGVDTDGEPFPNTANLRIAGASPTVNLF